MPDIFLLSQINEEFDGITYLPIFDIEFIPYSYDFSSYDGLIITSKNGVYSICKDDSFSTIPIYAIADKTATIIKQYGGDVVYTGKSGHGDDFANELLSIGKGKKFLYIRAKKVVSNLVEILNKNDIVCDELITYQTICKKYDKVKQPSKGSFIIFSSPSTINCFLNNFSWDSSYTAITIGKTTAKYLKEDMKFYISNQTTIKSCVELAIQKAKEKETI